MIENSVVICTYSKMDINQFQRAHIIGPRRYRQRQEPIANHVRFFYFKQIKLLILQFISIYRVFDNICYIFKPTFSRLNVELRH